ncbi:MAG: deoxyribose-phosphate aldolase [Defluviitaleaceae bacterium]|nr:deoxyribose-phosphate aldolase [Defluviitaleaceae bacterium]
MKPEKKAIDMTRDEWAAYIDHSVLKPEFTQTEIKEQILKGIGFRCMTVCVNPSATDAAMEMTAGMFTKVCVVCDFPFGLSDTASKVMQAEFICKKGVFELDMVANYGWIKSAMWEKVKNDIAAVNEVCKKYSVALKVILETDALTADEIKKGAAAVANAGAAFVKSSTGFYTGGKSEGATVEVVRAMLEGSEGRCKVKGSGGIRTRDHFLTLIDMGIDRMGVGYKSTPEILGA